MKCFRNFLAYKSRPTRIVLASLLAASSFVTLACIADPGILLGPGSSVHDWITNAVSGSGVEQALFRLMPLPGGDILFRRSPRESRPELTSLMQANPNKAALYSLRAMEDERALDFSAAEQDWKIWAQKAEDKPAASLDLADFYERRLKPQEELAALQVVAESQPPASERNSTAANQRPWKAFERSLEVADRYALPRASFEQIYQRWEHRYSLEHTVYQKEIDFYLAAKDYPGAASVIDRYRKACPGESEFSVTAQAALERARGGEAAGAAVYEKSFEPFWPASLIDSYMSMITANHGARRAADAFHARLLAHSEGGHEALYDLARLYYLDQKLGQLDLSRLELANYRKRKEARGTSWSSEELITLGQLYEQSQDFPDAIHYFYALAAQKATPADEEHGLAGLARILLTAPEQPLRIGAGNLAFYRNIATIDRGPGYWNGILSLWMNTQDASGEFVTQDQLATPYFHRARASQIIAEIDQRFPQSQDRPDLHQRLMGAYAAYGEDAAVIREGTGFLTQFPQDRRRVAVALSVADVYSRTGQTDKEITLYRDQLRELAGRSQGLPLNSSDYQQVLDRALVRLVQLNRLSDALALLRGELDRNPTDPALYDKLAQFLEQNRLNAQQENVYQKAIAQFQQSGLVDGWYGKLARFYLRERRRENYRALTHKVTAIFSGTELEAYLREAPAPGVELSFEVNRYAHERFPHDLTFVHSLLNYYRARSQDAELDKLLWEHWSEDTGLRDELFARLSASGRLDAQLEVLRKHSPEIERADWASLAHSNPAASLFWVESSLWESHYEEAVSAADALSAEYPADVQIGETAASLERSFAYFHPEATDKAVAIESRLLQTEPANLDRLARIGDIYADRGRMDEASSIWLRMADVHPGDSNGYLQSATVFWDYFDFSKAMAQLQKGRDKLSHPALYAFETGAIHESQGDPRAAIHDYAVGALADTPSAESRSRFLALARRPEMQAGIDAETSALLAFAAPSQAAIELRVAVLDASHRPDQVARELRNAVSQSDSFVVLDALSSAARNHGLREIEEAVIKRQVILSEDPVHKLELRLQLVDMLSARDAAAGAAEIDSVYRENPHNMGVVRSIVDYDWSHNRRPQSVTVLLEAAQAAYPDLRDRLQLEAARKLTELADYARSRRLLEELLSRNPLDASVESALVINYSRSGDTPGLTAFYRSRLKVVKSASLDREEKQNRLAQLRRGLILAVSELGQWDTVADQYIELINAFPGDSSLVEEAALVTGAHGQGARLTSFYRQTIERSPRDARWSIVLGQIQTALENYPAAIEAYGLAIRVRPEQKDLYVARAGLAERLHHPEDAAADYEKLYVLSYHDPRWKLKLAEDRARQGRNAEAVKALEDAWITGHPAKASDHFRVASQLEQWDMLNEARTWAERGADLAGPAWFVDNDARSGVSVYARIMARLRLKDDAFNRLASARMQAEQLPVDISLNSASYGPASEISIEEWRSRLRNYHQQAAREAFAEGLHSVGVVVSAYATPEEKEQFTHWLRDKVSSAADGTELRQVYLPAIQAAGLKGLEADLLWQFVVKGSDSAHPELSTWLQLQKSRVQLDDAGKRIEDLASQISPKHRTSLYHRASEVYRELNNSDAELHVLAMLDASRDKDNAIGDRYFQLLLAAHPNELVARSSREQVAQLMLQKASPELALSAVRARSANISPVWKSAYTGLVGLYLHVHQPEIRQGFEDALAPDRSIGDRVDHPVDKTHELAGEQWYYYGSRYGEYLDEENDPRAEGLMESEIEHTPSRASSYRDLASYQNNVGRAEAALVDYRHSLELDRDQPTVMNSIAILEFRAGHHAEAVSAWKQGVHLLAEEMDARKVPESFWDGFQTVLEGASQSGVYNEISLDVDNMLRIYLRRNGPYRSEPLLESAYKANGESLRWLMNMASQVSTDDDSRYFLRQLAASNWVPVEQRNELRSQILDQLRAKQKPGERDYEFDSLARTLIQSLLDTHQSARARIELDRILASIPENDSTWTEIQLQVADAEKSLPQLLARWKKSPSLAPSAEDLRASSLRLTDPGRRMLLRYVYETALDKRQLSAANFLGLAAVDLDEGKKDAALDLLKRLALAGADMFADTDAAAALLEQRKLYVEAEPFLKALADAFPWKADYQVRLAAVQLLTHPQDEAPAEVLRTVATNPKDLYADRLAAAKALRGRSRTSTGSLELDLLTHTGCISADEASHPYFVQARVDAAACVSSPARREELLRGTLADVPENAMVRLRYLQAAFAASQPHRALLAAEGLNILGLNNAYDEYPQYDDMGNRLPDKPDVSLEVLNPEERSQLFLSMIHARLQRGEDGLALSLIYSYLRQETNLPRRTALEKERDRLLNRIARDKENLARMPVLHRQLEQDRIVRPRIPEGASFIPRKAPLFEEDAQ